MSECVIASPQFAHFIAQEAISESTAWKSPEQYRVVLNYA